MTETVTVEKQVWKSTLNRSMVLEAENEQLKERNDSLNNRDINLCRIANGIRDENFALKELLKEIRQQITRQVFGSNEVQLFEGTFDNKLLAKIDQVLGEE